MPTTAYKLSCVEVTSSYDLTNAPPISSPVRGGDAVSPDLLEVVTLVVPGEETQPPDLILSADGRDLVSYDDPAAAPAWLRAILEAEAVVS